MNIQGIKIYDKKEGVGLTVNLIDILDLIHGGGEFDWSILYLYGVPLSETADFIISLEKQVLESKNGFWISWDNLRLLSVKYFQMYEIVVIGCRNIGLLQRFKNEDEMYKICDVTIQLFDCTFWEVHSKDHGLIERLGKSFKDVAPC